MTRSLHALSYVLISPVRNEQADIEKTIRSVTQQTVLPLRWVIVDDASSDSTSDIVAHFLGEHDWIELVRVTTDSGRSFGSKVRSFNIGFDRVRSLPYDIIGNLDGDISFDEGYIQFLLDRFEEDRGLGVAGTVFAEEGYRSDVNSFEGRTHVPGGCQLFRRACFDAIGGYQPSPHGGVDWIAVTNARMSGWRTRSFREKAFFHHRPLGTAQRSSLTAAYSYGQKDYSVGGHPLWELMRIALRATRKPYLLGGLALALGFFSSYVRGAKRSVSGEFIAFHRTEQMAKLTAVVAAAMKLRRIDPFTVLGE